MNRSDDKRADRVRYPVSLPLLACAALASIAHLRDRCAISFQRGATAMLFDLDRTTHAFDDAQDSHITAVTANDPRDSRQPQLMRKHLTAQFRSRNGNLGALPSTSVVKTCRASLH